MTVWVPTVLDALPTVICGTFGLGILIVMFSNALLTADAAAFAWLEHVLLMECIALLALLFALENPLEIALATPLARLLAAPTTEPLPALIADVSPCVRALPPAVPTGLM